MTATGAMGSGPNQGGIPGKTVDADIEEAAQGQSQQDQDGVEQTGDDKSGIHDRGSFRFYKWSVPD
jgi:hypothetical protein